MTFAQLRELAERQYELDERRSLHRLKDAFNRLSEFFGVKDATGDHSERATHITAVRLDAYAQQRLAAGRSRSCVNYELAAVRRAFRLAIEKRLLGSMPIIKLPKVRDARSGFFEDGDFAALLLELPADARRDLVEFLRLSGWRRDEGRLLQWAMVDMEGGILRLEEARSKSGKARLFPFGSAPALKTLLAKRWAARDGLYVFHIKGEPIGKGALRFAWAQATKRAGISRRLHDLRRTAARDFRRAGVSEGEIMKLCGWETRSMFDRYNIINEADLANAVAKRFASANGKPAANQEPSTESSPHLS